MKKVLGLDLGTTSIGWAMVNEAENANEKSTIIKIGVRVNPLTTDEQTNFEKGKPISSNADRTLQRGARRNLQRYKLRRENLIEVLKKHGFINDETLLSEQGNASTFRTYQNRAKAATAEITLEDFARTLLMINKKRGYKSSRKAKNEDEGQLIDGMKIAKQLYDNNHTPGQFVFELLSKGGKYIPDFYRSDLQNEFDTIWNFQKQFHASILTNEAKELLKGIKKKATADYFTKTLKIDTPELKGDFKEKRLQRYELRNKAINQQLTIGEVAEALIEINGQISESSGYLGAISDRSKELFFNKLTVGQYLWKQLEENPHTRLKGQVFYRQDYLDEFNTIYTEQAKHHKALTEELKTELRDIIIFYQRRLKTQKGLISFCEFENKKVEAVIAGKTKTKVRGLRVCPKSSLLFQEFKIWQILNNLEVTNKKTGEKRELDLEEKQQLFAELNVKEKLSKPEALKLLFKKPSELDLNYKEIEGNRTNAVFYEAYKKIAEISGHDAIDFSKMNADEEKQTIKELFTGLGINNSVLDFDSSIEGNELEKQPHFQLWHLLYSFEGDDTNTGDENLIKLLKTKFGFEPEYARIMANVSFQDDYGSLSSKAIRKILPHLKDGLKYDVACEYAGYNHSHSLTAEEQAVRVLKNKLEVLPKNTLRNPVVEKILNQMVNVVNAAIEEYGKPDEIRVELARELKKSAKERQEATESMTKAKDNHDKYRKILQTEFGLPNVSRNDIIRYKLYLELEHNGYKTLYTNTYIAPDELFSKKFDIEHIVAKAKLFDDSFSNKTLELKSANIEKADRTAIDYVADKQGAEGLTQYQSRVEDFYKNFKISKTKHKKLLMKGNEIPDGFIERELRNTQYIAKKAKTMLEEVFRTVTTTTGSVTDKLREDWQLVDIMQELSWDKYNGLGLTHQFTNRDGQVIKRITDWTKRSDHRHHAMDALTVAFTKYSHVQYLNNLNARSDKSSSIYGIEQKELYRDEKNKLRFKAPMPLNEFRTEAKKNLENTLVSYKAKNKVVTKNNNKFKTASGIKTKTELTPRGQLHLETVYGSIQQYETDIVKVGSNFDAEKISKVAKESYRMALLNRLAQFENDPKKAFTGKNSLDKAPLYLDKEQTLKVPEKVKLVWYKPVYTIRKEINPELNVEKVVDVNIRKLLQARLAEHKGDAKKAFSNLTDNPIWLNKEKGVCIKRVTITGASTAEPLHDKKDKDGNPILDNNGNTIPVDFVSNSGNHHVAVYIDEKGNLQDEVISFHEAVTRVNQRLPIINKDYKQKEGWQFLFTMKQNEYFVFPNETTGFNPHEIDLLNPNNYNLISPNLFRVQTMSKKVYGNNTIRDYQFRHHLETVVQRKSADGKPVDEKSLKDIIYKQYKTLPELNKMVKVRINHLGKIVQVGEY